MNVIAVNGSPRRDGNTFTALELVTGELEANDIETEILQIGREKIPGCIGCAACKQNGICVLSDDNFKQWTEKLYAADGVIFGSPVYYSGINGTLKSFLDRAFYQANGRMRHKIAASVLVPRRTGGMPSMEQLNNYFLISEMLIAPSYYWPVIHGGAKGEVLQDLEGVSVLKNLGRNMAWLLKMKDATKETLPSPEPVQRDWMNFIR